MTIEQQALAQIAGNIIACENVKNEGISSPLVCEALAYERIKTIMDRMGALKELGEGTIDAD
jgi:hypothetical protein